MKKKKKNLFITQRIPWIIVKCIYCSRRRDPPENIILYNTR